MHTVSKTADYVTGPFSSEPAELHLNSSACAGQLEDSCSEALHLYILAKLLILTAVTCNKNIFRWTSKEKGERFRGMVWLGIKGIREIKEKTGKRYLRKGIQTNFKQLHSQPSCGASRDIPAAKDRGSKTELQADSKLENRISDHLNAASKAPKGYMTNPRRYLETQGKHAEVSTPFKRSKDTQSFVSHHVSHLAALPFYSRWRCVKKKKSHKT